MSMSHILLLGAGKSSFYAIQYLLDKCQEKGWQIHIVDRDPKQAEAWTKGHPQVNIHRLNITVDHESRRQLLSKADLVISLLPAPFHALVAKDAAELGTHMLTASYATDEIRSLSSSFVAKDRILCMEMGLDPGIDHMIAMQMIDSIRDEGHTLHSFYAFTGALLSAQAVEGNPWQYKFTWSPAQVIRAGREGARFIKEGKHKFIPYQHIFRRIERIHIPSQGHFECYANRDSVAYRDIYGLEDIQTIYRGTLRPPGFCDAWHMLVQSGLTDPYAMIHGLEHMSHKNFCNVFLMYHPTDSTELKWAHYMQLELHSETMHKLKWIGLFEDTPIGMSGSAPAIDVLAHILEKKWSISPTDQDKVVLWEKIHFKDKDTGQLYKQQVHLSCEGEDADRTALAKTVGLTLAICAKLLIEGHLNGLKGLQLPTSPRIYKPILKELDTFGIRFETQRTLLQQD